MKIPEAALVLQLKEGHESAFKELVKLYQDKVYNTCLGFVKNTEDADDLAQEVFIEIYNSIGTFREDARLSTWIYRIAVNKSLEYIRKMKRKKRSGILRSLFSDKSESAYEPADFDHPGVQAENNEQARILFTAIDRLPENQKTAFIMHKVEGISYEQVAEIMGKSLSSIESLLHRARQNLQKYLYNYYRNL